MDSINEYQGNLTKITVESFKQLIISPNTVSIVFKHDDYDT